LAVRPLNAPAAGGVPWIPISWALAYVVAFGLVFFTVSWSYVDVYSGVREAASWGWGQYIRFVLGHDVEYRPLYYLAVKAAYELVGLRLWVYQLLVLIHFAAVLGLLIWLLRPTMRTRSLAACVAISCVAGLHTSRILFGFWPLGLHSTGLVLLLLAIALAFDPRVRAVDWLFFPLSLSALLLLESGLLLVPLLAALWWTKAPGVGARGVAAAIAAVLAYVAIRLVFGPLSSPPSVYTGSGVGFSLYTAEELSDIFEHAPWLFWLYNTSATFFSVVFSEPRAGLYRFVESLLRGGAAPWQWLHIVTSLATTTMIAVVLAAHRAWSDRDRWLLTAGLVLIVFGSGLGALYTRDRIGLFAGVGYAILLYLALAALLDRVPASGWRRAVAVCGVSALAAAWVVRGVETYFQLRDTAWDYHLEWTERFADLGGAAQPPSDFLTALRSEALASTPDDPRRDPRWTYVLFERLFRPGAPASRAGDAAADAAVPSVSAPFDIRWKPEVDEATRLRLEAELGLTDAQRVDRDPSGRTWTYRLRQSTRERIRSIVVHETVEDTARIDRARYEILE
jgi:hypothetical protein